MRAHYADYIRKHNDLIEFSNNRVSLHCDESDQAETKSSNGVFSSLEASNLCCVVIEFCGDAHCWGRKLEAFGLPIKLLPRILKAYVLNNETEVECFWNFPIDAIEEALVNAIYHRSYEVREPVEVRISPEEIIIISYPGADRSIRMDNLRKGLAVSRRYRNRRIGEFLKELELAEGRSTGMPKIFRPMRQNGSAEPMFESDDNCTYFLVRLPVHSRMKIASTVQDTIQDTIQDTVPITRRVEQVIVTLNREMSRTELQDELNLNNRSHFTRFYLQPALKAG